MSLINKIKEEEEFDKIQEEIDALKVKQMKCSSSKFISEYKWSYEEKKELYSLYINDKMNKIYKKAKKFY